MHQGVVDRDLDQAGTGNQHTLVAGSRRRMLPMCDLAARDGRGCGGPLRPLDLVDFPKTALASVVVVSSVRFPVSRPHTLRAFSIEHSSGSLAVLGVGNGKGGSRALPRHFTG